MTDIPTYMTEAYALLSEKFSTIPTRYAECVQNKLFMQNKISIANY